MQIKTGIDIVEVKRIKDAIKVFNNRFLNRIYTENEILYCNSKNNLKYEHFAARFAAKEAGIKAISELLKNKFELCWKDIEIMNNKEGKPKFIIHKNIDSINSIDLSISHIKEYAIASVTILVENDPKA